MRLNLVIKRHCLPTERVIWTTGAQSPASSASTTIAQLLEAVNEVFPLESGEWGLVDYAVEVSGFECLHFSELSQVLKEDDEVSIRPLQSSDVRARRASGRSQILSGGMKLIDGIPFGRPYRGQSVRPPIPEIPPRKRRRLLYDLDDEEDEAQWEVPADRQLMVREDFDGEDEDVSEDDEASSVEDILEEDAEGNDQDINKELALLLEDQANDQNLGTSPFDAKAGSKPVIRIQGRSELKSGRYALHDQQAEPRASTLRVGPGVLKRRKRKASEGSNKSVHFEDREPDTPITIHQSDLSEASADEPMSQKFTNLGSEESDKENTEPLEDESNETSSTDPTSSLSMSSESDLSSDDSEADTSSSETDGSDDTSDSDDESSTLSVDSDARTSSVSTDSSEVSSSDSSSDDDSDVREVSSKRGKTNNERTTRAQAKNSDPQSEANLSKKPFVSPGHGKLATKRRNLRRRRHNLLKRLQCEGKLPEDATFADLPLVDVENGTGTTSIAEAKQSLLESLAIEEPGQSDSDQNPLETTLAKTSSHEVIEPTSTSTVADPLNISVGQATSGPTQCQQSSQAEPTTLQSATNEAVISETRSHEQTPGQRPRMRIDVASSRRMLFGALGLSAPKTKQDEEKARMKLESQARHSMKAVNDESSKALGQDELQDAPADEYEDWQKRIRLNAVECCHDGISLTAPLFPFVQRWDPQQQASHYKTGGQGRENRNKKKRKRHTESHEEGLQHDESYLIPSKYDEQSPPAKHTKLSDDQVIREIETAGGEHRLSPHQDSIDSRSQAAIDDQLQREFDEISTSRDGLKSNPNNDLPELPHDLSKYPDVTNGDLVPGTIIAFKKLDMSVETNWQPLISDYKTAVITDLLDDGLLELRLASRDAPKRRDISATGEVIYSKFEMPDADDVSRVSDARILEIVFAELIEPKTIRKVESRKSTPQEPSIDATIDRVHTDLDKIADNTTNAEAAGPNYDISQSETIEADGDHPSLSIKSMTEPSILRHHVFQRQAPLKTQVSKEVRDIIKDAGLNSSNNIENAESFNEAAQDLKNGNPSKDTMVSEDQSGSDPESPAFNGFGSSPPHTSDVQVPSSPQDDGDEYGNDDIQSEKNLNLSDHLTSTVPEAVPQPALNLAPPSSQISSLSPSLPRSQRNTFGSDGSIRYPSLALQPDSHESNDVIGPRQRRASSSKSSTRQSRSHRQSTSSSAPEPGTSPPPIRDPQKVENPTRESESKLGGSSTLQQMPSPPPLIVEQPDDHSGSDSDLPDLATILSQPSQRQFSHVSSTPVVIKRSDSESRDFTPAQRPSHSIGDRTQIVELLSSDDLESTDESGQGSKYVGKYESQVLPNGSGWIKKSQAQQA